jgi:RNA polymerase sigma factor (sigma-70 family)
MAAGEMKPSKTAVQAKQIVFSQDVPLLIKRSAWALLQHEMNRTNPATSKVFTQGQALSNTLKWMAQQKKRLDTAYKELTPTQKKVIQLLVVDGFTQKEIALQLEREEVTIKRHFASIRKKIGVSSMYQAVAIAVERGWVSAPEIEESL